MKLCVECDIAYNDIYCPLCVAQDTMRDLLERINELQSEQDVKELD